MKWLDYCSCPVNPDVIRLTMNSEQDTSERSRWPLVRRLLRCETESQCQRIQHGSIHLKRIGKWSVLFSIGITLFISDIIAMMLDSAQQVETVTSSFLYRWTAGWVFDIPSADISLIAMWKVVDFVQFLFFFGVVAWCIRWVYADSRVTKNARIGFKTLMFLAMITNATIYFTLRLCLPSTL